MGIKDLTGVIKEYSPSSVKTVPLSVFSSYTVAIDIDILIHKFYDISYTKSAINLNHLRENVDEVKVIKNVSSNILDHIKNYLHKNKIRVIVVFGSSAPPEKDQYARKIRLRNKENAQNKLNQAKENYGSLTNEEYFQLNPYLIEEHLKIRKAADGIPKGLWSALKAYLEENDVICITAKMEAEELCAALCLEDKVQAVYSTDTDNIVRRCNILITKIENVRGVQVANIITYNDDLLKNMKMTYQQFFDMCILLGCDYNKRINGNGPAACYQKILEHKSIQNLMKIEPDKDWENVNYKRCKEIFNFNHIRSAAECSIDKLDLVLL